MGVVYITTYKQQKYYELAVKSIDAHITVRLDDTHEQIGVTAQWNKALSQHHDYNEPLIISNDDVVFAEGVVDQMLEACKGNVGVVGPVSNQPGMQRSQCLRQWSTIQHPNDWRRTDVYNKRIRGKQQFTDKVNGFCFALNPKALDALNWEFGGHKNFGSEYHFQHRMHKAGFKSLIIPAFVFHFKHVTFQREGSKRWRKVLPRL